MSLKNIGSFNNLLNISYFLSLDDESKKDTEMLSVYECSTINVSMSM
ncbi:hypothetical protein Bbad01_20800 [Bacillus badius]|nr:hypothetical protein Bbad01_20800 [Bacillus badius]